jgi:hypothetical protein
MTTVRSDVPALTAADLRTKLTITVSEFAIITGRGVTGVYDAVKAGTLDVPVLRNGRNIRIPSRAVLELLGFDPDAPVPQAPASPAPEAADPVSSEDLELAVIAVCVDQVRQLMPNSQKRAVRYLIERFGS